MNAAHLHLLLNHVPVLGAIFSLLTLLWARARRSEELSRFALGAFVLVGVGAVAVYLTGEPAEELVEGLPGVSHDMVEAHEEAALLATIALGVVALVALGGLMRGARALSGRFYAAVLLLGVAGTVLIGWAANLGGQIRHPEIRGEQLPAAPAGGAGEQP